MILLSDFCDKIIVIGLKRRTDRRQAFAAEMAKLGVAPERFAWFDGYDKPVDHNGVPSGNRGCTESHRAVLDVIAFHRWERVAVFEDDAMVRPSLAEKANELMASAFNELPANFRLLYLGAGYANNPKRRASKHLIEVSRMLTTSSYIITHDMAREMAPHISGVGPIDNLFHSFTEKGHCYCMNPRVFVQRETVSDLTDQTVNYEGSMTDPRHEEMLLEGFWKDYCNLEFCGPLMRRELAAPNDMYGETVIIEGAEYIIAKMELPAHKPSWYRGELVTYYLTKV